MTQDLRHTQDAGNEEWDTFVRQHPLGWMCALSCWQRVIESAFPHIRGHVLTLRDAKSGAIRAGLPLYTVKSWLLGTRLVSVPFATLSDPLVNTSEQLGSLFDQSVALANRERKSSVEIRTWRCMETGASDLFTRASPHQHQFVLLDKSQDELWKQLHATTIRQRITRAVRNGITVSEGHTDTDLAAFCHLITDSRRRLGLPPIPLRFFRILFDRFRGTGYVRILLARQNGEAVAAGLFFDYGDTAAVEYIGEVESVRSLGGGKLLYWEGMLDALRRGRRLFSMGRTNRSNTGLLEYKERWGARTEDLRQWIHPAVAQPLAPRQESSFYRAFRATLRHAPYPVYRLMGEFLYSHWG